MLHHIDGDADPRYPLYQMGKVFFVVLIVSVSLGLFAESMEAWETLVDFQIDLQQLCELASESGGIPTEKLMILWGSVGGYRVLSGEGEGYRAELELVSGRWIGVSDLEIYRAVVRISEDVYAGIIPSSGGELAEQIPVNSKILMVARGVGLTEWRGEQIPLLNAYNVRVVE